MESKGKVAFLTLGCKVNFYETIAMEKLFRDSGYELTDFSEKADIYIVNTCTVTNIADRKSRQMLHRARKNNPNSIVAAVGCYVQAAGELVKNDSSINLMIGNNKKSHIVSIVEAYRESKGSDSDCLLSSEREYEELHVDYAQEKTRAVIKIQDGCNQFCSYCIIPYVRGRVRSREIKDIISEIELMAEKGCHEVVLTGIHLSSYGVDLAPWAQEKESADFISLQGQPLLQVIKETSHVKGIERIRLGSLEPRIITEDFVQELSQIEKVCPHFHLSLQSGCDTTLKRMNRKYTTEDFLKNAGILRKYYEAPAVTTDLIVGFPGETTEELEVTKRFIETVGFAQMHIFKYSVRKGTRAEKMDGQVPESVKVQRSSQVSAIAKKMQKQYGEHFFGKEQTILFEEMIKKDGKVYMTGHTERYVKIGMEIKKEDAEHLSNQFQKITPYGWLDSELLIGK